MAERKELHGGFSTCSFGSSNSSDYDVCMGEDRLPRPHGNVAFTSQVSTPRVVSAVAPAVLNGVAGAASGQTVAVAAKISMAGAAAHSAGAEDGAGAQTIAGDSGSDIQAVGQLCSEMLSREATSGSDRDTEGLVQQQLRTCATAAAGSPLGNSDTRRTSAGAAEVPTAYPVTPAAADTSAGNSVNSGGDIANLAEGSGISAEESAAVVERAYSVCEEYVRNGGRRQAVVVEGYGLEASEECTEEQSTSAADAEAAADSACDGSTSSSASDCCGCVGPIAETLVPDAAGVPPYLRIETLPALLEEGAGGRPCVLLGQKKEALLYSVATPFGVNKCVLVCIYMLYAFLTGCVYFGWPSVSYMLLMSGAYSWRCPTDSNGEFINDLRKPQNTSESNSSDSTNDNTAGEKGGKYYICDEQDAAVAPLFTIAYVTQSLMSVVAGTLLDHVSPKRAAVLGQLLNATGWVLLACSSSTFQAYVPAMVFIGLGADTAYLPTLLIAALFPGKRATVITLLGSANTASFAVPMLLEMLWRVRPAWSFSQICWLYIGVGPFFCCFLAALFIPRTSFGSAALRKLPLQQQQQSPLQGSREDALLTAEEKETKTRCAVRKRRRSSVCCCCCCFDASDQDQEEKHGCQHLTQRTSMPCSSGRYTCCCCTDAERGVSTGKATASGGTQMLRRFLSVLFCGCRLRLRTALKLLQRFQRLRLGFRPQLEQPSRAPVVSQEQQQRLYDLRRLQPEPSSSSGVWRGRGVDPCDWRGSGAHSVAAEDISVGAASHSQGNPAVAGVGTVAEASTAAFSVAAEAGVETKTDGSALRSVNSGGGGGTVSGSTVHTEAAHATEPHEKGRCCTRGCARHECSGELNAGKYCCCVCPENRGRSTDAAAQEQQYSLFSSLFPRPSSTNEVAAEETTTPEHCRNCMLSPSAAPANAGSGGEKDALTVEFFNPGVPEGSQAVSCPTAAIDVEEEEEEDAEPSFCSQLLSSHFMCIVLYWSGMAVAISYFQSSSSRLFPTKALDFMDIALSFSFVPCVLLGKMIDLFGPFPALFLVNTMGVLAYCFALGGGSDHNILQYVSILAFCVYVSVDSEQVFCYVENTFNAKHFGKLSGLALTTGGVISLVSIPLYEEVTIRILKKNPFPVCCGLMVVLVLLYITLGSMWFVRMKHPPAFKEREKRKVSSVAAVPLAGLESTRTSTGLTRTEAEEKEGEQAYAVDGHYTHTAAWLPNGFHRTQSRCCCCCCNGCAGGSNSNSTHSNMRGQSRITSTNGEDNSTERQRPAAERCLMKRIRALFRLSCRGTTAVEALHQQRGTEQQQQQRRGGSLEHGEDNLRADVI